MSDIITLKNKCNKACHPLLLLQETVNESVKKANISTKTHLPPHMIIYHLIHNI